MILALIIVSLGVAQAIIGHTFLNPQIIADDIRELSTLYRVSPISGLIMYRPNSVFVSTGRFGNFLLVTWLLVFGFSGYLLLRHKRGRSFAFLVLALTVAGLALCSSRGVVLWSAGSALVGSVAFIWGAPWRQREVLRVLRVVQRAALGIVVGIVILLQLTRRRSSPASRFTQRLFRPAAARASSSTGLGFTQWRISSARSVTSAGLTLRHRHHISWHSIRRAFLQRKNSGHRRGERLRHTRCGDGHRRAHPLAGHELCNLVLGMGSREEAKRFTLVSTGVHDLLVRRTSAYSHDFCRNGDVRGFRSKRVFLASPRYFVPFTHARALPAIRCHRSACPYI